MLSNPTADILLDTKEAAMLLRVRLSTIYAWVHRRTIPYRKHGSRTVFSRDNLVNWSEARSVTASHSLDFILHEKERKNKSDSRSLKIESSGRDSRSIAQERR